MTISDTRLIKHAELRGQIAQLFTEQLSIEVPAYDTDLLDAGVLDSLKFVELLVYLEQQFGTQVSLNEFEWDNFRSIDRIAQFMIRRSVRETAY